MRARRATSGARTLRKPGGRSGSRTPNTMMATETKAGITAIQNTAVKLLAKAAMNTMASSGPSTAPMVSSDWRRPKALPRRSGGREIGDQRVTRRAADTLADAIDETRRHQPADARRQRKHRLGDGGEAVAEGGEPLALAEIIAERAGKDLGDRGGGLGDALDDADGQRRGAEHGDEIERQQRMDHLGGDVHEQRHQPERPDAARNFAPAEKRAGLASP